MSSRRPFCSDVSLANGEPLGATASRIDHWLIVEYRGLWGPDALRASGLSDQVKQNLREQVRARPRSRLLFVRRPNRRGRAELRGYAATSREGEESLRCTSLSSYEDLRELDLAQAGEPLERPLFLVCTHGKHDPCCARRGRPLFEALAEQVEEEAVWQTTHIGGDRFAGNLLCLSRGVYYGRVERKDAGRVLYAHLDDKIDLEHYRGRSCHSFAAQAAERDIRERTGLLGLDDLRLVSEQGSRIAFADRDGRVHEREVSLELGPEDYLTCTASEVHRPRRYVVSS
ncbi:MAG: sucrase ferredoxin [Actinobacteria bacterium]|nr:sucrase ferredoxin [Actinomycetota bacterium]